MSDCTLLKLGLEGIVAERRGWHVNDWGEKREREGKDPNPRTRFFGAYDKDPNYWNH
ncbi:hypothetical protein SCP_0805450 [Sparassis crispa]|uniref:Uncharacterized protein n=1 Tax=Sparassis crispa TaxID=139825 RepID=A0A401GUW2_9APHY|nr:hypothetical protein SCP_0805450 [Sparassis crispa]GBE86021.1 hypothetical protein SCP_0805450 [Sparassis crispa]